MATRPAFIPGWVTFGAVLGMTLGWAMFHDAPPSEPQSTPTPIAPVTGASKLSIPQLPGATTLRMVEQVFLRWGGYAVWEDDVTQFVLWSQATKGFAEAYEVTRVRGNFYYRPIAHLTRPLIDHGTPRKSPIAFAETQAQHDAFYRDHPDEKPGVMTTWSEDAGTDLPPKAPDRGAGYSPMNAATPIDPTQTNPGLNAGQR